MAIILQFLIVLLMIMRITTLSVPPIRAIWFYFDAKSRIAARLLSENMSAMMELRHLIEDIMWNSLCGDLALEQVDFRQ